MRHLPAPAIAAAFAVVSAGSAAGFAAFVGFVFASVVAFAPRFSSKLVPFLG